MIRKKVIRSLLQILLLAFTILILSPIIYMVLNSLKPYSQMLKDPWGLPKTLFLDNYMKAFQQMHFWTSLFNSVVITISSVFLIVVLGVLAAYPIARFKNKLTSFLSIYFLVGYSSVPSTNRSDLFSHETIPSNQYQDRIDFGLCFQCFIFNLHVPELYQSTAYRTGRISSY